MTSMVSTSRPYKSQVHDLYGSKASADPVLAELWDNPADAAYDDLQAVERDLRASLGL